MVFDDVTASRFRHGTRFLRWRPDTAPAQCTFEQIGGELTVPGLTVNWFGCLKQDSTKMSPAVAAGGSHAKTEGALLPVASAAAAHAFRVAICRRRSRLRNWSK